jgi:CDP-paratose 2-epimerase
MNILITGGCGFVGSNLSIFLKTYYENCEVYCFDNLYRRGSELNLQKILKYGCKFIHGDVRIKNDFKKVPKVNLIIDAAAEPSVSAGKLDGDLENLLETNLNGTINTALFAKECGASIIFLSTSRVYPFDKLKNINYKKNKDTFILDQNQPFKGITINGIDETFEIDGYRSLYGATKLSSEFLLKEFSFYFKIPIIINRCGVICGPNQMGKVEQGIISLWIMNHFWKKPLTYKGYAGFQVRDILHIDDLANLISIQIDKFNHFNNETFNIGGGLKNSISLLNLTDKCQYLTNNFIDIKNDSIIGDEDIPLFITDNKKINQFCGWQPQKNVDEILSDIFEWVKKNDFDLKKYLIS